MSNTASAELLGKEQDRISAEVTRRYFDRHSGFKRRWGGLGIRRCTEDTAYHVAYLAEAVRFDFSSLFIDYIAWAKVLLLSLRMSESDLIENLRIMEEVLGDKLHKEVAVEPLKILAQAIEAVP